MQTFLPYPDFEKSARCLDWRRLGKQRVEVVTIWEQNYREYGGWYNHPAVRMWRGYGDALLVYLKACIEEWVRRGYKNNIPIGKITKYELPPWFGGDIHRSHRAALLAKDYDWYSQFGWIEKPEIKYVWPV